MCPADAVVSGGTECRASGGMCDVAESCNGSSPTCPVNGFMNSSVQCRAQIGGVCDAPEFCTGSTADCPVDEDFPDGQFCMPFTGMICEVHECQGGECIYVMDDCPFMQMCCLSGCEESCF